VAAQGTKTIKAKKISSKTVNEYFLEEGEDDPVVESIERYDQQGELVELKEMNRKGDVKKWEKYVYDDEGNLVEEQFLDVKGRVTKSEKNIYKDGLRIEKQYYNSRDQMYKKKVYEYEYRE
jgi:tetrahydromethanopterin S-methyltransferase subunit A